MIKRHLKVVKLSGVDPCERHNGPPGSLIRKLSTNQIL